MFSHNRLLLTTCVSATLFAGFGCSSSDDDRDHVRRHDRVVHRDDPVIVHRDSDPVIVHREGDPVIVHREGDPVVVDRAGDRVIVNRDDRVVGDRVAGRGLNGIPASAVRVERGPGNEQLTYRPPRRGMVYVYDVDDDKLVYSGALRTDDKFLLDPNGNRAMINDRKVLDEDLKHKHRFDVYFDADR